MTAPQFVCTDVDDREAWLTARRTGLGASDAPAILGISPFSSPAKVAAQKSGQLPIEDAEETELMSWGRKVEPLLIQCFLDDKEKAGEKGWEAKVSGEMYRCTKPGQEIMMATLDGQARAPDGRIGIVECKLKIFGGVEWERHGIPDHVIAQNQHGMEVVDAPFCVTIGLLDGYRPRWKIVDRAPEVLGDVLIPAELDFWKRFEAGVAFPLDIGPPDVNLALLKRLYPEDSGKTVRLEGDQYLEAARLWRQHAEARLAFEKAEKAQKAILVGAIGEATFAILENGSELSLKTTRKKEVLHRATSYRTLREVAPKKGRGAKR